MSYLVLARKYRPQTFDELVGQGFVSTSLKNAMELKRVSHAYLFTGARGTGKTSAARIMAKALNCLSPVDNNPCNECENCLEIANGTSIDVTEIDGASNRGVEDIRQLREAVKFLPVKCKYKVYIVDEVHMLTDAAFNALLKTLEEPPEYVVFIFATTDAHKVIPTILSRCQRYDFRKIPFDDMKTLLEKIFTSEKVEYDDNALNLIIRNSEGCMRDALSFSDQVINFSGGKVHHQMVAQMLGISDDPVVGELFAAILNEEKDKLDGLVSKLCDAGVSLSHAAERMLTHTRNLLMLINKSESVSKELTTEEKDYYKSIMPSASEPRLFALFQQVQKLHTDIKYSSFARYTFEFAMYKAASLSRIIPLPVQEAIQSTPQASQTPKARQAAPKAAKQDESTLKTEQQKPVIDESTEKKTPVLTELENQWNTILKELHAEAPGLSSVLQHGALTHAEPGKVVIVFPKERDFPYKRASQEDSIKTLQGFFKRKFGTDTSVEIQKTGEDEKKKALIDKKNELESLYEKNLKKEITGMPAVKHLLESFECNTNDIKIIKKPED